MDNLFMIAMMVAVPIVLLIKGWFLMKAAKKKMDEDQQRNL